VSLRHGVLPCLSHSFELALIDWAQDKGLQGSFATMIAELRRFDAVPR
jgi:hypothetical protein